MLAQDARTGAGSADGDAAGIACANEFRHRGAAEESREAQLVPAREENAGRLLEPPQPPGFLAIAASVEIHHRHLRGPQVLEEFLIARSGFVHAARGGDDDDIGACAARNPYEALQYAAIVFLILGAADRHDPAASLAMGNFAGH